jgi:hypothetical protein
MQTVVYKIVFKSGDVYVGKTTRWPTRKYEHIHNKGKGSPLLEQAFNTSEIESFEIIEECDLEFLDCTEIYWIDKLKPSLNTLPGGEGMSGLNHPRSKYTKEQILEAISLYNTTDLKQTEICDKTGLQIGIFSDIIHGRAHAWCQELIKSREKTPLYRLYDMHNTEYLVYEVDKFIKEHPGVTENLLRTGATTQAHWSMTPHPLVILTSPDGDHMKCTLAEAKVFLKSLGLSKFQILQLTNQFRTSAKWHCKLVQG